MDIIIIHGSPGSGKTTVAAKLHEILKSPWFEFGWIPEFRMLNPHTEMSYEDEEVMTFETLMLVCKNYIKHGFENILLSDLNDKRIPDIPIIFDGNNYIIVTLYSEDNEVVKYRVLNRDNGNTYRDFEQAININNTIRKRSALANEYRMRSDNQTADQIADHILSLLT